MPTITSTRLTKKQSHSTKDAYCVRIERKDGKVIRYTNWDKSLVMSSRINKSGESESLSSNVTYYSLGSYTPSAINQTSNLGPSTFDLEGVLNAVEQGSGTVEETIVKTPSYIEGSVVPSAYENSTRYFSPSLLIDNDDSTYMGIWVDNFDAFSYSIDRLQLDFSFQTLTAINHIVLDYNPSIYSVGSNHYVGVAYTVDGNTYKDIFPMRKGLDSSNQIIIDLPETIKCKKIRLIFGPTGTGTGLGSETRLRNVNFYEKTTYENITSITRNDIRLGLYDFARIYVFITDSENPVEDEEKQLVGYWDNTELLDGVYVAEVKSLASALDTTHGRFYNAKCDTILGSERCGVRKEVTAWSDTMYAIAGEGGDARIGTVVKPSTENGFWYKATTSGFTSSSEPTWPTALGDTIVDGSITWETVYATTLTTLDLASVTDSKTVVLNTSSVINNLPNAHFENGTVEFTSGVLEGLKFTIKTYDSTTRTITFKEKMLELPTAGDTVKVTVGCKKRFDLDCNLKFGNKKNYQGFPHLPGTQTIMRFGGQ